MKMVMKRKPDTTAPPDVEGWYSTHEMHQKPFLVFPKMSFSRKRFNPKTVFWTNVGKIVLIYF